MRVGVATSSCLAAEAGHEVADAGGNAVDVAIAACAVTLVAEPGMVSPAGGGFITLWPAGGDPITVDGGVEMPGRGLELALPATPATVVEMDYAGGVRTAVGHDSIATPGLLAAMERAVADHGRLPWRAVLEPAVRVARDGFPLSRASHHYLAFSHGLIYGLSEDGHRALHDRTGALRQRGETIVVPHLAATLEAIAIEGTRLLHEGELGRAIGDHVRANGGLLGRDDLAAYEPVARPALTVGVGGWRVATAPPPSFGGPALAAMLMASRRQSAPTEPVQRIAIQRLLLEAREQRFDRSTDLDVDVAGFLAAVREGRGAFPSPSTVHTSTADSNGTGCSITASSGYGSGIMAPGTGLWLNNCLGELELNVRGYHAWSPGQRLHSNMAPTVARSDESVLAIGSPGADRITTAQHQVLVHHLLDACSLEDAVARPRLHVERIREGLRVACEPGLDLDGVDLPHRRFDEPASFFGGVAAVRHDPGDGFQTAADPRRAGATAIGGGG